MIDFRYHLVSIVAIFLALTLGLVVGATYLADPVLDQVEKTGDRLRDENRDLRRQKEELERLSQADDDVLRALSPQILSGRLKGQSVVFINAPGSGEIIRNDLDRVVRLAGARVSGTISLQNKYLEDAQLTYLDELVQRLGVDSTGTTEINPYDRAAAVLAKVLVTNKQSEAGRENADGGRVLSGFKDSGFLTYTDPKTGPGPAARATVAILVAPREPLKSKGAETDNKALLSLAKALDTGSRGGIVVGPPAAATDGGVIKALRDSEVRNEVSSVDYADTPGGQITTVFAIGGEMDDKSGQYGIGQGANRVVPSPSPKTGRD